MKAERVTGSAPWAPRAPRAPRAPSAPLVLFALAVLVLAVACYQSPTATGLQLAAAGSESPARLRDSADWPSAIDLDPDGAVWLSMSTDTPGHGGVARYSDALEFEAAWGVAGSPHSLAIGRSRDLYIDERGGGTETIVSRFTTHGRHIQSWNAGGSVRDMTSAPNGDLIVLRDERGSAAGEQRIVAFASTGKLLDSWRAPQNSLSITTDKRGHVYVGQRVAEAGAIWHYSMSGTRIGKWAVTAMPVGIDWGPGDSLYVAGRYGTPRGDVTIWKSDGSFVSGITVDAVPQDLSVARDGSLCLIVVLSDTGRREVRKYDSAGNLLLRLEDFHPLDEDARRGERGKFFRTAGGRGDADSPFHEEPGHTLPRIAAAENQYVRFFHLQCEAVPVIRR